MAGNRCDVCGAEFRYNRVYILKNGERHIYARKYNINGETVCNGCYAIYKKTGSYIRLKTFTHLPLEKRADAIKAYKKMLMSKREKKRQRLSVEMKERTLQTKMMNPDELLERVGYFEDEARSRTND